MTVFFWGYDASHTRGYTSTIRRNVLSPLSEALTMEKVCFSDTLPTSLHSGTTKEKQCQTVCSHMKFLSVTIIAAGYVLHLKLTLKQGAT
jgi:hypothetical protein